MSVAHDAVSESHTSTTGVSGVTSFNWNHVPSGTPRSALVFTYAVGANPVTGVTYDTVAMTAVPYTAYDSDTEPGFVQAWFLDNVGSGTKNIVVSRTNNAVVTYATCMTQTAPRPCEVYNAGVKTRSGSGAEQTAASSSNTGTATSWSSMTLDDGSPGTNSIRYLAIHNGSSSVSAASTNLTTNGTNASIDFGLYTFATYRETTPSQGAKALTITTAISDDLAVIGLAVREKPAITGSFTANAVIFKTITPTFAADAVIKKTMPVAGASFIAAAVIKKTQDGKPGAVFVQQLGYTGVSAGTSTPSIITLSGVTSTVGNWLVAVVAVSQSAAGAASVSDSKGNTWTAYGTWPTSQSALFYTQLTQALVSGDTITLTGPNAGTGRGLWVLEFRGLADPYAWSSNVNTNGSGAISANARDLLVGGAVTPVSSSSNGLSDPSGGGTYTTAIGITSASETYAAGRLLSSAFGLHSAQGSGAGWSSSQSAFVVAFALAPGLPANAVIKANSGTKTFAADAVIRKTITSSFLIGDSDPSFNGGAWLIILTTTYTFTDKTADAVLFKTLTPTFVANSVLLKSSGTKTFSADAIIRKTVLGTPIPSSGLSYTARGAAIKAFVADNFVSVSPTGTLAVGSMAVVLATHSSGRTSSVSDTAGNTWTEYADSESLHNDIHSRVFTSILTTQLTTGDTVTLTLSSSGNSFKFFTLWEVSSTGLPPRRSTGGGAVGESVQGGPFDITTALATGDILIAATGIQYGTSTYIDDADTLDGSWSTSQLSKDGTYSGGLTGGLIAQAKSLTGSSTQTYNGRISIGISAFWAGTWISVTNATNGFVASAVLKKTLTPTFAAAAIIKASVTGTKTADAIRLRTFYFGSGPDPR